MVSVYSEKKYRKAKRRIILSKKCLYYLDAQQLYVVELMNVSKIAKYFNIAPSTVSKWKKFGQWQEKREKFARLKLDIQEEFCVFGKKLLTAINEEFDAGRKIDSKKMYMFTKICPPLLKILKHKKESNIE
jgi:uncharacterized protein YjcR